MIVKQFFAFLLILLLLGPPGLRAQAPPKLVSVSPLGGQRGRALEVDVRGVGLERAYAVWLGPRSRLDSIPGISARYTKGPDGLGAYIKANPEGSRVKVQLVMTPDARVGFHSLSLISPGGLSGSISFWVGPDTVIQEPVTPHSNQESAQRLNLPVAIYDRISEAGQLNYYAFEIAHEQRLAFEVMPSPGTPLEPQVVLEPQLALYEAGGSFLDPRRFTRLLFHEEITQGGMPASRRMTYHFTRPGRYLVNFGNRLALGNAGYSYLLRIFPVNEPAASEDALTWAKRRLQEIRSRTVEAPAKEVGLVKEAEPNDDPGHAKTFDLPAVLEGTIGRPGDIDYFRFRAKAGMKLACEIQTPHACPPYFNLRLDILGAKGAVVLSTLHVQDGKIGTENAKMIQLAPELLGKVDEAGEYTVRVRDLTSVHGSPDHVYRVLIRPQIPHVGAIQVEPEGPFNLLAGARQRLTLKSAPKEDHAGTFALSVEGLPQGVSAFVGPGTIELVADPGAPGSVMPQVFRIWGLPCVGQKSGSPFLVKEFPVMVVKK